MALIKKSELKSLDDKSREQKVKDLKIELIKASVTANKTNAKTKEIKRSIAKLLTLAKSKDKVGKK
jgi:ribosomal protein L29